MNHRRLRILGVAVATAAALVGCTDARKERLEGARRALAAVPDVEVVGADAAGVLTLRSRSTGATTTIDLGAKSAPAAAPVAANDSVPATASQGGAAAAADGADASAASDSGSDAAPAAAAALAAPGTAASPDDAPAEPGTVASAATVAAASANAPTVVRDPQGRVQVIQGSGFRIERTPGGAPPSGGGARPAPGAAAAAAGARQRLNAPVVCAAGETRALQGVDIDVPGAGVVAERGCNLTIANVRVRSGGWGLVVNPGATVRVDDSLIEGRTGALDLYPGGNLSAWATTFRGALGRPATAPQFVDRGGNSWQ